MERIRTVVGWLGVLGYIVLVVIASENQQFHASFMFALLERYVPHLTVHQKYLLVFWTRKTIHVTGYACWPFVATTPVWAQEVEEAAFFVRPSSEPCRSQHRRVHPVLSSRKIWHRGRRGYRWHRNCLSSIALAIDSIQIQEPSTKGKGLICNYEPNFEGQFALTRGKTSRIRP